MRDSRRQTPALSKADAVKRWKTLAAEFKALGLTQPPDRMCVDFRRYGNGWAVFSGYQDTDD